MRVFTSSYWEEQKKLASMTPAERLLHEADCEDRIAEQFRNCTWAGDEHPSFSHRRKAMLLREAAYALMRPQQLREAAKKRKAARKQDLIDSMVEDADW